MTGVPDLAEKGLESSAFAFLRKPFEIEELIDTVDAAIRAGSNT